MINIPDLSNPPPFIVTTLLVFLIVFGRYLLIAGLFYSVFYIWYPHKWKEKKINEKGYKNGQFKKEVVWSCVTAFIFAFAGSLTLLAWQKGFTKVYIEVNQYPLWWLPLSLLIALLLHETYYYWLHRWMHHPKVFKIVHKVHHDSNITSPWTAFSFHPLEGLLQALFLPILIMLLPINIYIILIQLTFMTFSSVINHLDIEVYSRKFGGNIIGKWLIGATHHALHHKQFKYNYGLYFTFWDSWQRTESPMFKKLFSAKSGSSQISERPGEVV